MGGKTDRKDFVNAIQWGVVIIILMFSHGSDLGKDFILYYTIILIIIINSTLYFCFR